MKTIKLSKMIRILSPAALIGIIHMLYPVRLTHGAETLFFTQVSPYAEIVWPIVLISYGYSWACSPRAQHGSYILTVIMLAIWMFMHSLQGTKLYALYALLTCCIIILSLLTVSNNASPLFVTPVLVCVLLAIVRNTNEVEEENSLLHAFRISGI